MNRTRSKTALKIRRKHLRNDDKADKKISGPRVPLDWQLIWNFAHPAANENSDDLKSRNVATYSQIKRMILSGQVGPGNKLVHEDLAQKLSVSRTPVREALERLYQEGFVTRLPRRGFYVAGITRGEAQDIYHTRE